MKKKHLILLSLWFLTSFVLIGMIHSWHSLALNPETKEDAQKLSAIINTENWGKIHIIASGCGCSKYLAKYLSKRGPAKNHSEKVLFLGPNKPYIDELKASGFPVESYLEEEFKNFTGMISGVPLLVIHDDQKNVKYAGGYSSTMLNSTTRYQDKEIFKRIRNSKKYQELPAIGCAVGSKIIKLIDPLGLKYSGVKND